MAPNTSLQSLFSPAELSYLHTSLSLEPPVRSDGRAATQFRPLVAEFDILPGTNGSARLCFADGTEAVVGVKAEVEKTITNGLSSGSADEDVDRMQLDEEDRPASQIPATAGRNDWIELSIEIPGLRDDDALPVFIATMLHEALVASGQLPSRLYINRRFHWKLYIDILLISPPLSYPLPLLSLTTHLALLSTRLPSLKSEHDEDPLFDDDWEASPYLYSREGSRLDERPPITLLVMTVGSNIIFDPSKQELAVAESVIAISVGQNPGTGKGGTSSEPLAREATLLIKDVPLKATEVDLKEFFRDFPVSSISILSKTKTQKSTRATVTLSDPKKCRAAIKKLSGRTLGQRKVTIELVQPSDEMQVDSEGESAARRQLQLLSMRTIDPPSRLTPPGVPNEVNATTTTTTTSGGGTSSTGGGSIGTTSSSAATDEPSTAQRERLRQEGRVWTPPRGGVKRALVRRAVEQVLQRGGVADEVLDGLEGVFT